MVSRKLSIRVLVVTVGLAINAISWGSLSAGVITSFGVGEGTDVTHSSGNAYGVKVTTPGSGPWTDITFNFFKDADDSVYAETGVGLYVLTQEYNGLAGSLSSGTTGYVTHTTNVTGNKWVFNTSDQLNSSTDYYIYMDDASSVALDGGTVSAEEYFFATGGSGGNYVDGNAGSQVAYSLEGETEGGSEPIPEPGSLLIGGIAGIGMAWSAVRRRRRRQGADESTEEVPETTI